MDENRVILTLCSAAILVVAGCRANQDKESSVWTDAIRSREAYLATNPDSEAGHEHLVNVYYEAARARRLNNSMDLISSCESARIRHVIYLIEHYPESKVLGQDAGNSFWLIGLDEEQAILAAWNDAIGRNYRSEIVMEHAIAFEIFSQPPFENIGRAWRDHLEFLHARKTNDRPSSQPNASSTTQ